MKFFIRFTAIIGLIVLPACDFLELRQVYRAKADIPPARQTCQLGQFQIPQGVLDTAFNGTGFFTADLVNGDARLMSAVLTPDCEVIAAVTHSEVGNYKYALIKMKLNGELDKTFGVEGVQEFPITNCALGVGVWGVNAIALQEDNKLIFSYCQNNNMITRRLFLDGSTDVTFGDTGVAKLKIAQQITIPESVAIQKDGKILITGHVGNTNWTAKQFLVRYLTDGTLDPDFLNAGIVITQIPGTTNIGKALVLDADQNIYVQGSSELGGDFTVTKYLPTGYLDAYFGQKGVVTVDIGTQDLASGIAITSDNKILVAGVVDSTTYGAFRLLMDGTLDSSFGTNGVATYASSIGNLYNFYGYSRFFIQENGETILSSFSANYAITMIRFDEFGNPLTFGGVYEKLWDFGHYTGYANIVIPLPDGRIFAGTGIGAGSVYHSLFYLIK